MWFLLFSKPTLSLVLLTLVMTRSVQAFSYTKLPRDDNWPYSYVSVGQSGVWAINRANKLFYHTGTYDNNAGNGSDWQKKAENVKQVDVGTDMVCFVTTRNELKCIPDISKASPFGGDPHSWTRNTKYIALSSRHDRLGSQLIDTRGRVLSYIWMGRQNNWNYQNKQADTITLGVSGIWATRGGVIMYKTLGNVNKGGSGWVDVDRGQFQHVTSGSGVVLAVRTNGELVQRKGITCFKPTGTGWIHLLSSMTRVDSYGTVAWAVDTSGDLYFIQW